MGKKSSENLIKGHRNIEKPEACQIAVRLGIRQVGKKRGESACRTLSYAGSFGKSDAGRADGGSGHRRRDGGIDRRMVC